MKQPIKVRDFVFNFSEPFPTEFATQDDFEDFILDKDDNDVFGDLKELISEEEGLDIDDDSEEQEVNEMVWQEIYKESEAPYTSHY